MRVAGLLLLALAGVEALKHEYAAKSEKRAATPAPSFGENWFIQGDKNDYNCPEGYNKIWNYARCKQALTAVLGGDHSGLQHGSDSKAFGGCMFSKEKAYFNTHWGTSGLDMYPGSPTTNPGYLICEASTPTVLQLRQGEESSETKLQWCKGGANTECADGYALDRSACQGALSGLGTNGYGGGSVFTKDYNKNCFVGADGGRHYYNSHPGGAASASSVPICWVGGCTGGPTITGATPPSPQPTPSPTMSYICTGEDQGKRCGEGDTWYGLSYDECDDYAGADKPVEVTPDQAADGTWPKFCFLRKEDPSDATFTVWYNSYTGASAAHATPVNPLCHCKGAHTAAASNLLHHDGPLKGSYWTIGPSSDAGALHFTFGRLEGHGVGNQQIIATIVKSDYSGGSYTSSQKWYFCATETCGSNMCMKRAEVMIWSFSGSMSGIVSNVDTETLESGMTAQAARCERSGGSISTATTTCWNAGSFCVHDIMYYVDGWAPTTPAPPPSTPAPPTTPAPPAPTTPAPPAPTTPAPPAPTTPAPPAPTTPAPPGATTVTTTTTRDPNWVAPNPQKECTDALLHLVGRTLSLFICTMLRVFMTI